MNGVTMLVYQRGGRDVMLTDADAIARAFDGGAIDADTPVTVYLSGGNSSFGPASDHPHLRGFLTQKATVADTATPEETAPEPDAPDARPSTADRLRTLEAEVAADLLPPLTTAQDVRDRHMIRLPKGANGGFPNRRTGRKSRFVAAILAAVLGVLGAHKFYMGKTGAGVVTLTAFLVGAAAYNPLMSVVLVVVLVEALIYLLQSDAVFQSMLTPRR